MSKVDVHGAAASSSTTRVKKFGRVDALVNLVGRFLGRQANLGRKFTVDEWQGMFQPQPQADVSVL